MRILILGTMLRSVMLTSVSAAIDWPPTLIWNASAGVPIGLCYVPPEHHLAATDLVVVMPPEPVARFLAERGYLPRGVPLLKQALALPGQTVCRNHLAIMIDGVVMSFARERDPRGRRRSLRWLWDCNLLWLLLRRLLNGRQVCVSFKFGDPAQIRLLYAGGVRAALVARGSPIILAALFFVSAGAFELRHFVPKEFGELKIEIYKLG
jgi:type IV secretory pathway protease TraF